MTIVGDKTQASFLRRSSSAKLLQLILLAAVLQPQDVGPYKTWHERFSSRLKNLFFGLFGNGFNRNDSFENFMPLQSRAPGSWKRFFSRLRWMLACRRSDDELCSVKFTVRSWNVRLEFFMTTRRVTYHDAVVVLWDSPHVQNEKEHIFESFVVGAVVFF